MVPHTTPRRNPPPARHPARHPERAPAPLLAVRAGDQARWQAALLRALAFDGAIESLGACRQPDGIEARGYRVASHSAPGSWRRVRLLLDTSGQLVAACDCPAHGPCWHLALAIDTAGLWPDGLRIAHAHAPGVPSAPCCPSCGALDTVVSIMRETNPRGWQPWYRCADCRAVIGYGYELDAATRRLIGVPAWV